MGFKDKIVLVTGASRGIGKAIALAFARKGASVVIDFLSANDKAEDVVKEIEEIGSKALAVEADVSDENQVKNLISKTIDHFGKLDILVNNAGIVFDVPFSERTVKQWQDTLNVDLIGSFLCAKYAAPFIKKSGGGRIINIASTNGINTYHPTSMDYDAAKAGVIMLTKNLAMELSKDNILVNAVAPGWVDTDMNKDLPPDFVKEETEKVYVKRFAKPEEIANVVTFLASKDASYINATTIVVDGGY